MGGQASSGSFQKGSQKAREAGHKGGMARTMGEDAEYEEDEEFEEYEE